MYNYVMVRRRHSASSIVHEIYAHESVYITNAICPILKIFYHHESWVCVCMCVLYFFFIFNSRIALRHASFSGKSYALHRAHIRCCFVYEIEFFFHIPRTRNISKQMILWFIRAQIFSHELYYNRTYLLCRTAGKLLSVLFEGLRRRPLHWNAMPHDRMSQSWAFQFLRKNNKIKYSQQTKGTAGLNFALFSIELKILQTNEFG